MSPALQLLILTCRPDIRFRWEASLSTGGWTVTFAPDAGALGGSLRPKSAFAVVDLELPGLESALARLKRLGVPYFLFGAVDQLAPRDIIAWLEAGADDVLPAALEGRLLTAKLRAHLRSWTAASGAEVLWSPKRTLKAELGAGRAFLRQSDGRWKPVAELTATEFQILGLLLRNPGAVLERRFILESLWGGEAVNVRPDTVNKHVEALRRKLRSHGASIRTVYGTGYAYRED